MGVRLRLTLLYGALFLLSGAGLLAITYVLVDRSQPTITVAEHSTSPAGEQSVSIFVGTPLPSDIRMSEVQQRVTEAIQQRGAEERAATMRQLLVKSGVALGIMAVVSAVLGWLVAGRVLRPLQTMTDTIQRISARNGYERLAVAGPPDELKNLADTVDGLLGRLEAALDSHKRFVANAAHELRTPLTLEHALLEEAVLDPDATADSLRAQFRELMAVSEQQARLLESLLVLATSERGLDRREPVDLGELTADVLRARPGRPEAAGEVNGPGPGPRPVDPVVAAELRPAPLTGDPALVERLVANLVDNAVSYNVPGGEVAVTTGTEDGRAFLAVTNTGRPVPPEMVERLLSPFQRLDRTADDGHHGLGLSIVQAIAMAHAAELTVLARPAGGLAVTVRFPAVEEPSVPVV
jgi:signal transduction histidine kinase